MGRISMSHRAVICSGRAGRLAFHPASHHQSQSQTSLIVR
jgi:hypothetical protein